VQCEYSTRVVCVVWSAWAAVGVTEYMLGLGRMIDLEIIESWQEVRGPLFNQRATDSVTL
jgi:hypothetical protein